MVNEATLLAARRNRRNVGMQEMEEAIERGDRGTGEEIAVISDSENGW